MDRNSLLGLCAALNVAQAMLDEVGLRGAGRHVNAAVVAVHREARWTEAELARMAEAQAWVVRLHSRFLSSRRNPPARGALAPSGAQELECLLGDCGSENREHAEGNPDRPVA